MKVLVTGSNGFVGRVLCGHLHALGHTVVPAVRRASGLEGEFAVGVVDGETDWNAALSGCDAVVHLAARVHVMDNAALDPIQAYRTVNTDATLNLARQASQHGVRRFVFISTIKVNGECRDAPYREIDLPSPDGAYAQSKWEAERGLWEISNETGLEIVVLRPPLIYGPGVKANFLQLIRAIARGQPLPLGAARNRRSLLYIGNFVDAISACLSHPAAAGKTFLVADGEDVSTPGLIRRIAAALNRPPHVFPFPSILLRLTGAMLGKRSHIERLLGSLAIDGSRIHQELGWAPPYSMREGLQATIRWYLGGGRHETDL